MEPIIMGGLLAACLLAAEIWKMSDQSYKNRNRYNDLDHWHLGYYDSKLRPRTKFSLKNLFKIKF